MQTNIVIVGAGIAGLVSALLLSEREDVKVTIVEKSNEVGGLLKKFDYGVNGFFDYGAHNLLETNIEELDKLLFSLLAKDEWEILDGYKREIAGAFFNQKIQKNSAYIDLRNMQNYPELLIDFVKDRELIDETNLYDYFFNRYGKKITEVLRGVVENLYQDKLENLDSIASLLAPLSRVILFDKEIMHDLNLSDNLRAKLAYPEQRDLDLKLSSGRKALYPKNYGMYRIIDALVNKLEEAGVEILTNNYVKNISIENQMIREIVLADDIVIGEVDKLIWSAGMGQLLPLLDITPTRNFDNKRVDSVLLNLLVSHKLNMDDVYYLYGYSKDIPLFRVTAYYNYCPNTFRNGGYPVSIEILEYNNMENLEEEIIDGLRNMGLLSDSNSILFSKLEVLNGGFVHPSKKNSDFFNEIRTSIASKKIKNLINIGIMSEKNLFFQTDILIDLYQKIRVDNV